MDNEFKEFLDLNKISYAKAERLKRKKDGRVLPLFCIEINNPTKAEALISQNLVCQITGMVYKVEEFRSPVSVRQCFNCQSFRHSAKNCKCTMQLQGTIIQRVSGIQQKAFRQHLINHQETYASTVLQNTLPQPKTSKETFSLAAEQLTKFAANVVIQIAQSQAWQPNPKQETLDLKSSMYCKVFKCSQNNTIHRHHWKKSVRIYRFYQRPCSSKPFTFMSTKVNLVSKNIPKAPTVLTPTTPPSKSIKAVPKQPKTSK